MKSPLKELMASLPKPVLAHIQHLERMRQDFVANVSHELRTPLTVVHGYLETILENNTDKNLEKIYSQMYQQTLRMENLIADLLLLSSLEEEEPEKSSEKAVDVYKMLEIICDEARQLSGNSKHKITLSGDPNLRLRGNAKELRSLFSNIIFNAVKYTPAEGKIDVSWKKSLKKAIFKVSDTGIGIEKKHLPRITERFYRVDKARSRESGGTGLGLAIAKHVLIRHKGQLQVESHLGKGSVFSCVFPEKQWVA